MISQPSVQSLFLQLHFDNQPISTGTGFVANSPRGPVLVTNWHNLSGRHPDTGQPLSPTGAIPNQVVIIHNRLNHLGQWVLKKESLLVDDKPLWFEHPQLGSRADVVALPLTQLEDVHLYPYSLGVGDPKILVSVSDYVSVVGFPFGMRSGGAMAIWATGFVATEPTINHENLPIFLVDCRARQGQSGSAVIAHRSGGMVAMETGGSAAFAGHVTRFLGIYSGRINKESDLGIVWKASAIRELIDAMPKNTPSV